MIPRLAPGGQDRRHAARRRRRHPDPAARRAGEHASSRSVVTAANTAALAADKNLPRMDNCGISAQHTEPQRTVLDDLLTPTDQKVEAVESGRRRHEAERGIYAG